MSAHIWMVTLDLNGVRSTHSTIEHSIKAVLEFAYDESKRMTYEATKITGGVRRFECNIVQIHRAEGIR